MSNCKKFGDFIICEIQTLCIGGTRLKTIMNSCENHCKGLRNTSKNPNPNPNLHQVNQEGENLACYQHTAHSEHLWWHDSAVVHMAWVSLTSVKASLMLNDILSLGWNTCISGKVLLFFFFFEQANAKPHSGFITPTYPLDKIWMPNWPVCRLIWKKIWHMWPGIVEILYQTTPVFVSKTTEMIEFVMAQCVWFLLVEFCSVLFRLWFFVLLTA